MMFWLLNFILIFILYFFLRFWQHKMPFFALFLSFEKMYWFVQKLDRYVHWFIFFSFYWSSSVVFYAYTLILDFQTCESVLSSKFHLQKNQGFSVEFVMIAFCHIQLKELFFFSLGWTGMITFLPFVLA